MSQQTQKLYETIRQGVKSQDTRRMMSMQLVFMLSEIGFVEESRYNFDLLVSLLLLTIERESDEVKARNRIAEFFWEGDHADRIRSLVSKRGMIIAENLAAQVNPFLPNDSRSKILDYGCGDGLILSKLDYRGFCYLYDIVETNPILSKERKSVFFTNWDNVKKEGPFGLTIVSSVLHHSLETRLDLLKIMEVSENIVVFETYLDCREYRPVYCLIDWFWDRCINYEVNVSVPGSFKTLAQWESLFSRIGVNIRERSNFIVDFKYCPITFKMWVLEV